MITRPAAVGLLFDLRSARMLAPFLGAEHTLSTAAAALGVPTSTLAYWIPKLQRAGLLRQVRTERRAGAPMRWYRAVGHELFVPMASIPVATRSAFFDPIRHQLLDRFIAGMDEQLDRDPAAGVRFQASGERGLEADLHPPPSERSEPWTEFWGTVTLTRPQAHALAGDLAALVERYRALDDETAKNSVRVMLHAGAMREPSRRPASRRRAV